MKTREQLTAEALATLDGAIPFDEWAVKVRTGVYATLSELKATKHWKAGLLLDQARHAPSGKPHPPPAPTPAPTPQPVSVFSGVGLFAAERPQDVTAWEGRVQWAALLASEPGAVEATAQLVSRGVRVAAWEEHAGSNVTSVRSMYLSGAIGYVATAEGPDELNSALSFATSLPGFREKALVCNDTVKTWPPGWTCMPEAYTSLDPNATADQMVRSFQWRGATVIVPVVLLAAEGGRRMRLVEYAPALQLAKQAGAVGYGLFRVETAAPDGPEDVIPWA